MSSFNVVSSLVSTQHTSSYAGSIRNKCHQVGVFKYLCLSQCFVQWPHDPVMYPIDFGAGHMHINEWVGLKVKIQKKVISS